MADFIVSATCTRVAVRDGHTESARGPVEPEATLEEVVGSSARSAAGPRKCGFQARRATRSSSGQSKTGRSRCSTVTSSAGMATVIGRVRPCPVLGVKYVLLGHNTIRGAAGASILNAELFKEEGLTTPVGGQADRRTGGQAGKL